MANQNATTKPKAPAELSSSELLGRVSELEKECGEMVDVLVFRGQHVASAQMFDAVSGLHKTKSCWNKAIEWERPNDRTDAQRKEP